MSDTDSPSAERRPRGRPRDPERLARVLETAKKHFTEHGYEGASVDAIAEASGVSKVTIYSYFPTKSALFQTAITHRIEQQFAEAEWSSLDPKHPREALTRVGRAFLALMRSPDVINHHRSLYGAQGVDTAGAESFFAVGPQKLVDGVSAFLRAAQRAGSLKLANPATAANQYLSMFLGLGHIRALLGLTPPSAHEDDALLKANVDLFLNAMARREKPASVKRRATRSA